MKKIYIAPEMEKLEIEEMDLLLASGVSSDGDVTDIGYGGWDTEGLWEPQ